MFCPSCGARNAAGARTCAECGRALPQVRPAGGASAGNGQPNTVLDGPPTFADAPATVPDARPTAAGNKTTRGEGAMPGARPAPAPGQRPSILKKPSPLAPASVDVVPRNPNAIADEPTLVRHDSSPRHVHGPAQRSAAVVAVASPPPVQTSAEIMAPTRQMRPTPVTIPSEPPSSQRPFEPQATERAAPRPVSVPGSPASHSPQQSLPRTPLPPGTATSSGPLSMTAPAFSQPHSTQQQAHAALSTAATRPSLSLSSTPPSSLPSPSLSSSASSASSSLASLSLASPSAAALEATPIGQRVPLATTPSRPSMMNPGGAAGVPAQVPVDLSKTTELSALDLAAQPIASSAASSAPAPAPPSSRRETTHTDIVKRRDGTAKLPDRATLQATTHTGPTATLKAAAAPVGRAVLDLTKGLRFVGSTLVDAVVGAGFAAGAGAGALSSQGVRLAVQPIVDFIHANPPLATAILLGAPFVGLVAYQALTVLLLGGTLGQRIAGLRVLRLKDGGKPGALRVLVRAVAVAAGTFGFLAGPLWGVLIDRRRRGFGDILARTVVARARDDA